MRRTVTLITDLLLELLAALRVEKYDNKCDKKGTQA